MPRLGHYPNHVYRWCIRFATMSVVEAQRLKETQSENARLKRLLAERDVEVDALQAYLEKKP